MEIKSKAGGGSDGNGWERAGKGLCRATVVGKGHRAAQSQGKLCHGTLRDFWVESNLLCLNPLCSGAVREQTTRYCL